MAAVSINKRRLLYPRVGFFLAIIFLFGGGYLVGGAVTAKQPTVKEKLQYVVGKQANQPEKVDFSVFWEAWSAVDNKYFGTADKANRLDGSIAGMLASLDDPYSVYLPKDESAIFKENLSGKFSGIGAEISYINGWPTIVSPLPGSPAEQAGLKPKDIITKVDDKETSGENFGAVINRIRGEQGSPVKITVVRDGAQDEQDFTVIRDVIELPSVIAEVKTDGNLTYGYLNITEFLADTKDGVKKALDDFVAKKVDSIVIDLRNDPGGVLDGVIDIASLIIDTSVKPELNGVIVYRQAKDGTETAFTKTTEPIIGNQKIVTLVNAGSASASEILAGALKDYGRSQLIGKTTFGKGSVQEVVNLSNGGSVKITVAKWLTPAKLAIDHEGIKPDYEVDDLIAESGADGAKDDPQLTAALNLLR